jgi:hypothetical protein
MKSEFPIFLAADLLLGSSGAEGAPNNNIILAPPSPISSTPPQTNPGAIGLLNPANPAFGTSQNFGALPGNPGSPTYNPNAALPSLGNSGSALAPSAGTSSSGINTPSTSSGTSGGM